jgi:hypothetical protein
MRQFRRFSPFGIVTVLLAVVWAVVAQTGSCPALVEQALASLGDNCDALDRNSACYGFNQVDSTFFTEVDPGFFSQPSDRSELTNLQSIQTAALDLDNNVWGIAVMNALANVPNTLPGQAVTFLLLGDAQVENRVDPHSAILPSEPLPVTVKRDASARSGPGANTNVVAVLIAGTELESDAINANGLWMRVVVNDRVAWVSRSDLEFETEPLSQLRMVTENTRTPMQAFYFSTGTGQPSCNEAPDVVTIQSRENLRVSLTVNGAEVGVGSTISFKQTGDATGVIVVQEGSLTLPDGTVVEAVQSVDVDLDEEGAITGFGDPRPPTDEELSWGAIADTALAVLFGELEIEITPPTPTPTPRPSGSGSGDSSQTTGTSVDCRNFRATSPLNGLAYGINTFYWDAAPGAEQYRVTVFNDGESDKGTFTQQFFADAPDTMVTGSIDQGSIGGGFQFSWIVEALVNGRVICTSQRVFTERAAAQPIPNPLVFTITGSCVGIDFIANWAGADPGDFITITVFQNAAGPIPLSGGVGASGSSLPFANMGSTVTNIQASASPSGKTASDPGPYTC